MVEYLNYRVLHPIMMVELVPKFTLQTKKKWKREKEESVSMLKESFTGRTAGLNVSSNFTD